MGVPNFQAQKAEHTETNPNPHCVHYSITGDTDDAWVQLYDLKVFETMNWAVEFFDVIPSKDHKNQIREKTINDAGNLKDYLDNMPIARGTRYM